MKIDRPKSATARRELLRRIANGEQFFQPADQSDNEQQRFDREVERLDYLSRKGYVGGFKAQVQTSRATGAYAHAHVRGLTEEGRHILENPPRRFSFGKVATFIVFTVAAFVCVVWGFTGNGKWEPLYSFLVVVPVVAGAAYALFKESDI